MIIFVLVFKKIGRARALYLGTVLTLMPTSYATGARGARTATLKQKRMSELFPAPEK